MGDQSEFSIIVMIIVLMLPNNLLTHRSDIRARTDIPKCDNSNSIFEISVAPTLRSENPI